MLPDDGARRARWGTPNTAGVSIPQELVFENIHHQFGGQRVLEDVSLVARSGTVTCLLGPSGSGKTTLLRIAAGMEQPTAGRVSLDGKTVSSPGEFVVPEARGVGMVFQDFALFPHLDVLRNVMFGLAHLKRSARHGQAMNMLERVGLGSRAADYPHQLSGGEQQRVALARALAPRPGILLMDEPFSGLDSRLRDTMREETLGVLRETRATSIIVTHDPEEALRMGDQIALLHRGRLEQTGTGRDLYFRPQTLFAASFFSELNYFEGVAQQGRVETPLGPVAINGVASGSKVMAAVRVNAIGVKTVNGDGPEARGRVLSSHFSGDHDYLRIGIAGVEQPVRARVRAGELSAGELEGKRDVLLVPAIDGCFAFLID